MVDIDAARTALRAERDKLAHQLDELGATEQGELRSSGLSLSKDFADAGAATAERTELLGLAGQLAMQLTEVDEALASIDAGTYGICSSCGIEIPAARLEARPASLLCVECKSNQR